MATKLQCKSYLPGYSSTRDLNEESNSCSWPLYYGEKVLTNGQYYNGFLPKAYLEHDKDLLKRTMMEHEGIFKKQVYELHRVYRIQRNLMDELKRNDRHKGTIEKSLSSSPLVSQVTSNDARKWHNPPSLSMVNSVCARPSISVVEDNVSPISSRKGTRHFPSQNTEVEALESRRPTKIRRKLIDLHLPADEYIYTDEAEQLRDDTVSGLSTYLPNRVPKTEPQTGENLFVYESRKSDRKGDVLKSGSCLRSSNGLADLNEPIQVEETNTSSCIHHMRRASCYEGIQGHGRPAGNTTQILGLSKEMASPSNHVRDQGPLNHPHSEGNGRGRGWFSHVPGSGNSKTSEHSVPQSFQSEKLPTTTQSVQVMFNNTEERSSFTLAEGSKVESWRESRICSLETPDLIRSQSHQVLPWENRSSSLDHESKIPVQTTLFSKSSVSSRNVSQQLAPRHGIHGDKWLRNQNPRAITSYGSELPVLAGGYPTHLTSISYDNVAKHRYDDNIIGTEVSKNNGCSGKLHKGSNGVETVSLKNVNLNVPLSDNEAVHIPKLVIRNGEKRDDNLAVLPWLASNNRSANLQGDLNNVETGRNETSACSSNKRILGLPIFEKPSISKDDRCHISVSVSAPRLSENEEKTGKHLIDLNINLPCVPESEHVREEDTVVERVSDSIFSGSRHQIDLNICVNEVDDGFTPRFPSAENKVNAGIDLEVPLFPEKRSGFINPLQSEREELLNTPCTVGHDDDDGKDDLSRIAAEAIVAISSFDRLVEEESGSGSGSSEASTADPLNWFVDIIDSCGDLERKLSNILRRKGNRRNDDSCSIDFFEYMTLKLSETTEEEYMPKPLIPESLKLDETTTGGGGGGQLHNQTRRRGHARRGRQQRRDFQRDILPGLASLSRHEVTEDLQTFCGLMKATGHTWETGSTRRNATRNGCKRGRRRLVRSPSAFPSSFACAATVGTVACTSLVQQLSNVEAGVEDRSLTGWGKTTRRPRRQRCSTGNLSTVGLTGLT